MRPEIIWKNKMDQIRQNGIEDFASGKHYHHCPYADGTQAKKIWVEGFDQTKLLNKGQKDAS